MNHIESESILGYEYEDVISLVDMQITNNITNELRNKCVYIQLYSNSVRNEVKYIRIGRDTKILK